MSYFATQVVPATSLGLNPDGVYDNRDTLDVFLNRYREDDGKHITIEFSNGSYLIGESLSIPRNVSIRFLSGGALSIPAGVVVTFLGTVEAGAQRIYTGAGSVLVYGPQEKVLPQWWGAVDDGTADTTAALVAMTASVLAHVRVVFPTGTYLFSSGSGVQIPRTWEVDLTSGAVFQVTGSTVLNFRGQLDAPPVKVFDLQSGGKAILWGNSDLRPEWWGAVADGTTDSTTAIQQCLDSLPDGQVTWSSSGLKRSHSRRVLFRSYYDGSESAGAQSAYLVTSPITIPDYKSVALEGESRSGARIRNGDTSGNTLLFRVNESFNSFQWATVEFRGLVFDRGGIRMVAGLSNSRQGGVTFEDCIFFGAPATPTPAIEIGTRFVYGWIRRCVFDSTGGVLFSGADSDLWHVNDCSFLRGGLNGTHADVTIKSSGVYVYNNDFEVRTGGTPDTRVPPYVLIDHPATDCRIYNNRFGNEPTHPKYAIQVGEVGANTSTGILGVTIRHNQFKGSSTLGTNVGEAAIRLNRPLQRSLVEGNFFWHYQEYVDDAYVNLASSYARYSYDNVFRNNVLMPTSSEVVRTEVFVNGGSGWATDLPSYTPENRTPSRPPLNYVQDGDFSGSAWTKSAAASVAKDAIGPDGVAASAYTLTRTGSGSCYVNTGLISVPSGVPLVFSVWAKAGTKTLMRITGINQDNQGVTEFNNPLVLTSEWRLFRAVIGVQPTSTSLRMYLYNGIDATTDTDGTILLWGPRIEVGDTPHSPRSLDAAGQHVSLLDYVTSASDHTAAFQRAIRDSVSVSKPLFIPKGTWTVKDVLPISGMHIVCESGVNIQAVGGTGAIFKDPISEVGNLRENIRIDGGLWNNCDYVIQRDNTSSIVRATFRKMVVSANVAAFDFESSIQTLWDDCSFTGNKGIVLRSATQSNINTVTSCQFMLMRDWAIETLGTAEPNACLRISDSWFEDCWGGGIRLGGGVHSTEIHSTYFEDNGQRGTLTHGSVTGGNSSFSAGNYVRGLTSGAVGTIVSVLSATQVRISQLQGSAAFQVGENIAETTTGLAGGDTGDVATLSAKAFFTDIQIDTDGGGQNRPVVIRSCHFATPSETQGANDSSRVLVRGQSHVRVEDCHFVLRTGQAAIDFAASDVYHSEFHNNYVNAAGGGTYVSRLLSVSGSARYSWSSFQASEGVTNPLAQMHYRGELYAQLLNAPVVEIATGETPSTGAGEVALFASDGTGGLVNGGLYARGPNDGTPFRLDEGPTDSEFSSLESTVSTHTSQIGDIEDTLGDHETRIGTLEDTASGLQAVLDSSNTATEKIRLQSSASSWTEYPKLVEPVVGANNYFGNSVSVNSDATIMVVGTGHRPGNSDTITCDGVAYVYTRSEATWTLAQTLTPSDGNGSTYAFGFICAITEDGNTIAVCAPHRTVGANALQGSVYVFTKSGASWVESQILVASDGAAGDTFGANVAFNEAGTRLAISAYGDANTGNGLNWNGSSRGSVYVFDKSDSTWNQTVRLTHTDSATNNSGARMGSSLAISGDGLLIVAGAPNWNGDLANTSNSPKGTLFFFEYDGSSWTESKYYNHSGPTRVGNVIALAKSGHRLAVGLPTENHPISGTNTGDVHIFTRDVSGGGGWLLDAKLFYSRSAPFATDNFGTSVRLNSEGTRAVVTAAGDSPGDFSPSNHGSISVFELYRGSWREVFYDFADDAAGSDLLGGAGDNTNPALALSADDRWIVAGASNADHSSLTNPGAVYVWSGPKEGFGWFEAGRGVRSTATSGLDVAANGGSLSLTSAGTIKLSQPFSFQRKAAPPSTGLDETAIFVSDGTNGLEANGLYMRNESNATPLRLDQELQNVLDNGYITIDRDIRLEGRGMLWTASPKVIPNDPTASGMFGWACAINSDGTRAVITCGNSSGPGATAAYVFDRSGNTWTQTDKLVGSDLSGTHFFGHAVAISDDGLTIAVSAHRAMVGAVSAAGAVYIYQYSGGSWGESKIVASDPQASDYFGYSLALNGAGTRIFVGAPGDNGVSAGGGTTGRGAFYCFSESGGSWSQSSKVTGAANSDGFGYSIDVTTDGTRVVVGAPGQDTTATNSGAVYSYTTSNWTAWSSAGTARAATPLSNDGFGFAVSINDAGDVLAVGVPDHDPDGVTAGGAVYVLTRSGSTWTEVARLYHSDVSSSDALGSTVSLNAAGTRLVAGSRSDDDGASAAGSVTVYHLQDGTWKLDTKLLASDAASTDQMADNGLAISKDGLWIVAGINLDDHTALTNPGSALFWGGENILDGWLETNRGIKGLTGANLVLQADGNLSVSVGGTVSVNKPLLLSDSAVPSTPTNQLALFSGNGTGANDNELYYRQASDGATLRIATDSDVASLTMAVDAKPDNLAEVLVGGSTTGANPIRMSTGSSLTTETPGNPLLLSTTDNNAGTTGSIDLAAGHATGGAGNGGGVSLTGGDGPDNGGNIVFTPGTGTSGGLGRVISAGEHKFNHALKLSPAPIPSIVGGEGSLFIGDGTGTDSGGLYYKNDEGTFRVDAGFQNVLDKGNTASGVNAVLTGDGVSGWETWSGYFSATSSMQLGASVDISGDGRVAVAGARQYTTLGGVYVFERTGNAWVEKQILVASDRASTNWYGQDVAISRDRSTIVVGHPNDDNQRGAIYIYRYLGGTWTELQKIVASDAGVADKLGTRVDINHDGSVIVASSPSDDDAAAEAGAIYVFEETSPDVWTEEHKLTSGAFYTNQALGGDTTNISLSPDGTRMVAGSPSNSSAGANTGSVDVFTYSGGSWAWSAQIQADTPTAGESFGSDVAISGDGNRIVVGARGADSNDGAVYVFDFSGSWTQTDRLSPPTPGTASVFGSSVGISDDGLRILVGEPNEDSGQSNSGKVWVLGDTGASWLILGSVKDSFPSVNERLGNAPRSIALSGDGLYAITGNAIDYTSGHPDSGAVFFSNAVRDTAAGWFQTNSGVVGGDGESVTVQGGNSTTGYGGDVFLQGGTGSDRDGSVFVRSPLTAKTITLSEEAAPGTQRDHGAIFVSNGSGSTSAGGLYFQPENSGTPRRLDIMPRQERLLVSGMQTVEVADGTVVLGQFAFDPESEVGYTSFMLSAVTSVLDGGEGFISIYNLTEGENVLGSYILEMYDPNPTMYAEWLPIGGGPNQMKPGAMNVYEVRAHVNVAGSMIIGGVTMILQ